MCQTLTWIEKNEKAASNSENLKKKDVSIENVLHSLDVLNLCCYAFIIESWLMFFSLFYFFFVFLLHIEISLKQNASQQIEKIRLSLTLYLLFRQVNLFILRASTWFSNPCKQFVKLFLHSNWSIVIRFVVFQHWQWDQITWFRAQRRRRENFLPSCIWYLSVLQFNNCEFQQISNILPSEYGFVGLGFVVKNLYILTHPFSTFERKKKLLFFYKYMCNLSNTNTHIK